MKILFLLATLSTAVPTATQDAFDRLAHAGFDFGFECAVNRMLGYGDDHDKAYAWCIERFNKDK